MSGRRAPPCGVSDKVIAECVQSSFPSAELSSLPYLSLLVGLTTTAMRQDPLLVLVGKCHRSHCCRLFSLVLLRQCGRLIRLNQRRRLTLFCLAENVCVCVLVYARRSQLVACAVKAQERRGLWS